MKTAIIYTRSASPNVATIQNQISLCKLFAKLNGFKILRVYSDYPAFGIIKNRPALDEILNDLSNSEWDSILILNPSKLSTDPIQYINFQLKVNFAGKRIISITEQKEILL